MNLKEFFKPTVGKLFLTFVLLMGVGSLFVSCEELLEGGACRRVTGFPLDFSRVVEDHSKYVPGEFGFTIPIKKEAIPINIAIDIVFWYIIAILISYLTKKVIARFNLEKYIKPAIVFFGIVMCILPFLTRDKYVEFNRFILPTGFVLFIFSLLNFTHMRLWKKIFYAILATLVIVMIWGLYVQYKNSGTLSIG